jgi:excisionase family DNA binding protein
MSRTSLESKSSAGSRTGKQSLSEKILPTENSNRTLRDTQIFLSIAYYSKIIYNTLNSIFVISITEEATMERLMTTEEVAELLRIDVVTVRRLVARGELTAYRIAGEYRFTPSGIENFVESQRVGGKGPTNQFDKFTNRARTVLSLANEEARRYNHGGIGTEHVLLAIMSEGEGIAAKALDQLHVQQDEVRKQIEALHPAEEHPVDGPIGVTRRGKDSIELAVQEARLLNHHYIGTEHLLLGLIREEEGLAGQVLRKSGVTLEETRNLIKQILATGQTEIAPEPEQRGEP